MNRTSAWRANAVVVAVLCLLVVARIADGMPHDDKRYMPFVLALFGLPFLYVVPGGRRVWARHRYWLLAVQAVLTYLPFVLFGSGWVGGMSGLLAGLLLLTVAPRASWLLAAAVLVVEELLWLGVVGAPYPQTAHFGVWVLIATTVNAMALFGLARLADLLIEVHTASGELAALAVTQERVQVAEVLRSAIGDRLTVIAGHGRAALRTLAGGREEAVERMAVVGGAARAAVADLRAVAGQYRDPGQSPPATPPGRAEIAPRVAKAALFLMLIVVFAQHVNNLVEDGAGGAGMVVALVGAAAIVALQWHHCRPRPGGMRPRAWGLTLALQVVLVYCYVSLVVPASIIFVGVLGGTMLLLLRGPWGWSAYAAVVASVPVILAIYPRQGLQAVAYTVYATALMAAIALFVYGLARLSDLAARLEVMGGELARMAVLRERLRVARDVHDLLGLGLSTVALKSDLVRQLLKRGDDDRARAELTQLVRVSVAARAESRRVIDETHQLSLAEELAAARDVLSSAGIQVEVATGAEGLPATVEAVLAVVLREGVTNILRHSGARRCTITTTAGTDSVCMSISNDGVSGPPASGAGGSGLDNLGARLHAAGGRLDRRRSDGRFELVAQVPIPTA